MLLIVGLALCFTFAFVAERIGLAGIVGAFAAGLVLDPTARACARGPSTRTLAELLEPLVGFRAAVLRADGRPGGPLRVSANATVLGFGAVLSSPRSLGKLACALGVLSRGVDRLAVAIGMIPRGEVGLIFAGIGASLQLDGAASPVAGRRTPRSC